MKKSLLILLALLLAASMLLTACDLGDDVTPNTTEETTTEDDSGNGGNGNGGGKKPAATPNIPATPPTGYEFYTHNDFRFVYPAHWSTKTMDSGISVFYDEASSDNLTFCFAEHAATYERITSDNLASMLPSAPETTRVSTEENPYGLTIKIIYYTMRVDGTLVTQYIYYTVVDGESYALILSDYTGTLGEMSDEIYNSMVDLSPEENGGDLSASPEVQDPNAPTGYKTFTNYNLRFAYPADWTTSATSNSRSVVFDAEEYNLVLQSGTKTTMFSDLTTESFIETMVPNLEESMGGTISGVYVEHGTNQKGLPLTVITYEITVAGQTAHQAWFCVTIDESTHWMMLSILAEEEDETLLLTILNSIEAVNGPNVGESGSSNNNSSNNSSNNSTKPINPKPEQNGGTNTSPAPSNPGHNNNNNNGDANATDPGIDTQLQKQLYFEALDAIEAGNYDTAYYILLEIQDYKDVPDLLQNFSVVNGQVFYGRVNILQ